MNVSVLKSVRDIEEIAAELSAIAAKIDDITCGSLPVRQTDLFQIQAHLSTYANQLSAANACVKNFVADRQNTNS